VNNLGSFFVNQFYGSEVSCVAHENGTQNAGFKGKIADDSKESGIRPALREWLWQGLF
jgi:hypothetical protein